MNAEIIKQIEAFLEGRISREELEEVADAAGITDLDEEIEWLRNTQMAIEAAALRDQLKNTLATSPKGVIRLKRLRPTRVILAIAASLLLVLLAYWGFNRNPQADLYAKYEYRDPGLPVLMSQTEDYLLYDALTYFGEGNYAVAREKLTGIRSEYLGNDTLEYYLGASLLYLGEPEGAQQSLRQVLATDRSKFRQRAEWLMVLAFLRQHNEAEARIGVAKILETPEHEFFDRAQSLQSEWED